MVNRRFYVHLIFIFFSLSMLLMPIFNLNFNKMSVSIIENRFLANMPKIVYKDGINFNYGRDFDNWLKDRFWGRLQFIKVNKSLRYLLSQKYVNFDNNFIDKNDKFIYWRIQDTNYDSTLQLKLHYALNELNDYCQQRGVKLYLVAAPRINMVYIPKIVRKDNNNEIKESFQNINKDRKLNLFFLLDDYLKAKDNVEYPLFYKTDTHTTFDGAFVSYNSIMENIQKDFPSVKIVKPSDFEYYYDNRIVADRRDFVNGVSCNLVGLPDTACQDLLKTKYRYYKHINAKELKLVYTSTDYLQKTEYYYPYGSDIRCMLFSDSNGENLSEFLPYSFKHLLKIRINGPKKIRNRERFKFLKYYEGEIENFKPDIIIIYLGYSAFKELKSVALNP